MVAVSFNLATPASGLPGERGLAASARPAPDSYEEYDWKWLTASVLFVAAQAVLFTYPAATARLARILPIKIDHDILGTLCNAGLSVFLDLYLQAKKDKGLWSEPSRWNPMTISSFIFSGYVMGISCRNINAGLEKFQWGREAAPMGWISTSLKGLLTGQRIRLPGSRSLLFFGLKSVLINTIATPLWAIGNIPWLMAMDGTYQENWPVYWKSVQKNFEWGWTRRLFAFSFSPKPTHGLFYLLNHGGMAFQQMKAVDEATMSQKT